METLGRENAPNISVERESTTSLAVHNLIDLEEIVQELESCNRKSKLMASELFGDYLTSQTYTGEMLLHYRHDAATRGEIVLDELVKAETLIDKLFNAIDTIGQKKRG